MIGSTIAHDRVTARLGEGGMGEVYRARDSRPDREVAVKVLPTAFVADPERLVRFEREARLLASLNHPDIAQIHGLEASGETYALVMELMEGPTLAEIAAGRRGGRAAPGARPVRFDGIPGRSRELAPNTGSR